MSIGMHSFNRIFLSGVMLGIGALAQTGRDAKTEWDAATKLAREGRLPAVVQSLKASLEAGWERPSLILVEPNFIPLLCDPASRKAVREMLLIHAREADIVLATPEKPGEPLRVSGLVLDESGRPIPGAMVYVFHTDQAGLYSENGLDESNPRLFGVMRTDANGAYRFTTIRPGHYPDEREPVEQHIHYEIRADGFESRGSRLMFHDDPFWERHHQKPHPRAEHVTKDDDGVCTCTHNVTLRATPRPTSGPAR